MTTTKRKLAASPRNKAKKPAKHAGGRPTDYKPEYADMAAKLLSRGALNIEIADFFGISIVTLWNWRNRYAEFFKALTIVTEEQCDRTERSLFERANGYTYEAVKIVVNSTTGKVTKVKYLEHVPPDVGAARLLLTNRRGDKWKDRTQTDHGVTEELGALIASSLKQPDPKKSD